MMMMMMSLPASSGNLAHEPVTLNITHYKGDTFELMFTYRSKASTSNQYNPISLAGITVQAKIYHPTTLAVLDTFTSTTPADALTVTPADGQVLWKITPTRLAQWGQNNVKFDVKLIKADGSVQTLIKGPFTFSSL
ncbi:MAG: hypothetical protein NTW61_02575 [Candidatus Melainabacteria bacterium]|jgi:hypothetical protein|nr:hypothetical protein [Candidatus Melainabacteria bacterium]